METIPAFFHPAVAGWFKQALGDPTEPQARGWPSIAARQHTLIAAPTGSGKTLAAFLAAINELVIEGLEGGLPGVGRGLEDATRVLYISPLKALSNDIQKNLQEPLQGIQAQLEARGLPRVNIRTRVRTGDTPAGERSAMLRRPPHILVTTPESFYILLTSEGGRRMLRTVRTVIVDEIHALVADKRGSHLALSLERLEALTGPGLVRIGLSATQRPIEDVARFLVGSGGLDEEGRPRCTIVDAGHARELDLAIQLPGSPLEAVMAGEVWEEVFDQVAELIRAHRTTLVFVNTRRMAERVAGKLSQRIGEEFVTSHHGSMAKEQRLDAEQRLKAGSLRALVATASLELGIDIGAVEMVVQLGSPRSIAGFLQRVGRSGHGVDMLPKGRLFPASRDDLVECAALLDAWRRGELDLLKIPEQPLDILAQQIVAIVAGEEWSEQELYDLLRRAHPYRNLAREKFTQVLRMLADGFATGRGRRGAHLHRDVVNGKLRGRKGARLAAITCGGAIPDTADYEVVQEPGDFRVGTVNEDFAIESMAGDIFQLGNTSWRILRVEPGKVRVADAKGQPPTIPFWVGEAPGRTHQLSAAVSRLREEVAKRLVPAQVGQGHDRAGAIAWLREQVGLRPEAAEQLTEYLAASWAVLGVMPSQNTLVMERFFDESGGMQLVIHSPFGSRLNRAWGLALRKRFCRKFNFELQAAANDDCIVLSLGVTHSFRLEDVFRYLHSASVRQLLIQALLDAPMFTTRWRWNATRSLAVLRWRGGRKVPPPLQRMQAEDLIAVVFPDQIACFENLAGEREIPDHPLVEQTIRDCLEEAMDIDAFEALLRAMEAGEKKLVGRDLSEPSPLAQEILNAKPYAFLDDAPLEERRTQAVINRRWLDPDTAAGLGALDAAAIEKVRQEAWPQVSGADELHDALVLLGFLTAAEGAGGNIAREGAVDDSAAREGAADDSAAREGAADDSAREGAADDSTAASGWGMWLGHLMAGKRATVLHPGPGQEPLWVSAERLPELLALFPAARLEPPISPPPGEARSWTREQALVEILRSRLEGLGPVTAAVLAAGLGLAASEVEAPLLALEGEGFVLRGNYTPGIAGREDGVGREGMDREGMDRKAAEEWCERRLLARIHRYTLNRLRAEIEPVSAQDFMRFLVDWQHAGTEHQPTGAEGLGAVLEQLEGFEAAAAAWEEEILPLRLESYDPAWLDGLCLSGRFVWARLNARGLALRGRRGWAPVRATPIALISRKALPHWRSQTDAPADTPALSRPVLSCPVLSSSAAAIEAYLERHGASFYSDLAEGTRMLPSQAEGALAELAALGRITSDSFAGLRALLKPASKKRRPLMRGRQRSTAGAAGMESAGRWALLTPPETGSATSDASATTAQGEPPADKASTASDAAPAVPQSPLPPSPAAQFAPAALPAPAAQSAPAAQIAPAEGVARSLLRRYGVVFRRVLERESSLPPWRDLLRALRRLEARGEIRGGRFVAGFSGEQYALPEAVGALRALRRRQTEGRRRTEGRRHSEGRKAPPGGMIVVSAADPLNLAGIITPGDRLPAIASNRMALRDGLPVALREGGKVRLLIEMTPDEQWEVEHALLRRKAPLSLQALRDRMG